MPKQISRYSLADEWNGIICVSDGVSSVVIVELCESISTTISSDPLRLFGRYGAKLHDTTIKPMTAQSLREPALPRLHRAFSRRVVRIGVEISHSPRRYPKVQPYERGSCPGGRSSIVSPGWWRRWAQPVRSSFSTARPWSISANHTTI
jgi:hypothetical protein